MRTALAAFALVGTGLLLTAGANFAQDKKAEKEVVLKGLICCNKCELGKSTTCETLIQVKDEKSKEDVSYFFDKTSDKKFHSDICQGAKKGSVTAVVTDDGKKKVISVKKVTYD
jgi:Family of unknown function (DUF6370)